MLEFVTQKGVAVVQRLDTCLKQRYRHRGSVSISLLFYHNGDVGWQGCLHVEDS